MHNAIMNRLRLWVANRQKTFPWRRGLFCWVAVVGTLMAHEGHQPLPTKGVQVDLAQGQLTLSREARGLLDVQTEEVQEEALATHLTAYASLTAPWQHHAYVTSRLAGRIMSLNVRPGDVVEAGQTLAEVDSIELRTLELDHRSSQIGLALAERLVQSLDPLAQSGAVSGQLLIDAQNTRRQAQNALTISRAKFASLGMNKLDVPNAASSELDTAGSPAAQRFSLAITSPIRGVIVHADVAVGKYVEPTEHLFEIVDTTSVWVKIGVLERDLHRAFEGQPLSLQLTAYPGRIFVAQVDKLSSFLDPQLQQGTVWAEVRNQDAARPLLLPGMNGQVELREARDRKSLTVPAASLFSDGAEQYVLVEAAATRESAEYRKESVVIGRRVGGRVELLAGDVYPGDRVVTRGGHELSSLFVLGVLRLSPETAKNIGLKTEPLALHEVEEVLTLDARVDVPPEQRTTVSFPFQGRLERIHVDRGQQVRAGDVLADIASFDLQDFQLDLLRTHLQRELYRETLARYRAAPAAITGRQIWETESRFEDAESQFQIASEKLRSLGLTDQQLDSLVAKQELMAAAPLRSPIDGTLVHFDSVLGQVLRPDQTLCEIHDLSMVWVQAFVSERDSALVQVEQPARIRLVAYPGITAEGTVIRMGPVVGADSRVQAAWIEFKTTPSVPLQHNMLARVTVTTGHTSPTWAVPLSAVVRDGLQSFVFVQTEDGTFDRRRVELGRSDDRFVEIQSGLTPGELVATSGVTQLQTAYSALR